MLIAYFKLFRRFILRALARSPVRSGITLVGIALGVAVMISIRLANASSLDSFKAATGILAGEASLRITGTAGRFDELKLRELDWLNQYGRVSPVVEGIAMMGEPGDKEFLHVLGVDASRDRPVRDYHLLKLKEDGSEPTTQELLIMMADPGSVILTEKLAHRKGLAIGSTIFLTFGDSRQRCAVRGLLLDQGPARALGGDFALMQIAAAQKAFNRPGLLDRVDLKLNAGVDIQQAESDIARRLPDALIVSRPDDRAAEVERMISAFHFNLNALASIALLVGLFLIYNTVSVSVISRRDEIGILRATGASRRLTLALFLGEAGLLSFIGTVVGIALGPSMASAAVRATATTVETFYIANIATESAAGHHLGASEILIAFAVALPLSLLAAARPALEASRVHPSEAMSGAERLKRSLRPSYRLLLASSLLIALGYILTLPGPLHGLPVFAYLSAMALVFAGAFAAPNAIWFLSGVGRRVIGLAPQLRVEAGLAASNLRGTIPRLAISIAALSISLAMMTAVSIMISSFRETVTYWVDQTMVADIYAKPVTRTTTTSEGEISPEALDLIRSLPEVAAVSSFGSRQASYEGNLITIGVSDFRVALDYGRLLFKSPANAKERMRAAIGKDEAIVSESFAIKFNKNPGDEIDLPTPAGVRPFKVAAVYYDYSSNRGTAVIDRAAYEKYSGETHPGSLSIYVNAGYEPDTVKAKIADLIAGRYQLVISTNRSLRQEVMRIFDSTFAITYALEFIAITVAALGVISTLLALIIERRGEIAVLGFIGATRGRIRRMILIEAFLIGGVSQAIGIAIGVLLSLVLIYVINVQSFGWTIQFHFPIWFLIQSTVAMLVVSALAGYYPASRAARVDGIQFAREE
ncbi:MAG: hypothetical protein DMF61_00535 [Blastocatellia bacterium AA13]|nr:MAG: hypothetical protein DMF61_00535 [Blastocatellia bacterium AA13]